MSKRRLQAVVIGPGNPGTLKIQVRRGGSTFVMDVQAEKIPSELRLPNSSFVALVNGRDFVAVDLLGNTWVEVEDRIRTILNGDWDPIGVAQAVDDEYDGYIEGILALLTRATGVDELMEHLRSIEIDRMALRGSSPDKLRTVPEALRSLQLP
jgi:hypothetical protein